MSAHGEWPNPVSLRRGWSLAMARPWNDDSEQFASLRLHRGGWRFLRRCVEWLSDQSVRQVLSPAMTPEQSGVWRQSGFLPHLELVVFERTVPASPPPPDIPVSETTWTPLEILADIDNRAFPPTWRVGRRGLADALAATSNSTILTVEENRRLLGFSIVGETGGVSYLQRLAVEPDQSRRGIGRSLVRHSLGWAARHGARTMLLNTQPDNRPAAELYVSEGFIRVRPYLQVLATPER